MDAAQIQFRGVKHPETGETYLLAQTIVPAEIGMPVIKLLEMIKATFPQEFELVSKSVVVPPDKKLVLPPG